jgi:hypothetical protein
MTDAQTIMDHEALKRDADLAGFDIKMPRIGEAYSIAIFGRKENDFTSTSSVVWFHTIKEAIAWVMGYRFRQFERQDFEHGRKE